MRIRGCRVLTAAIAAWISVGLVTVPVLAETERTVSVSSIDDDNPDGGCTLREAIDIANAGVTAGLGCSVDSETGTGSPIIYRIVLPPMIYTLTGSAGEDQNLSGDLDVQSMIILSGQGTEATILDGGQSDRLFHVLLPTASLSLENLTLRNGQVSGTGARGGAIYNDRGFVGIRDTVVENSHALGEPFSTVHGGAVHNQAGTLEIHDSILRLNSTDGSGGAVSSFGSSIIGIDSVSIATSQFVSNTAESRGGALYLATDTGIVNISKSLIAFNSAEGSAFSYGGGVYRSNFGNGYAGARLTILASTIIGNHADTDGGGIHADVANIGNSSILDNSANGDGGGAYGSFNLSSNTIIGNFANRDGGGVLSNGPGSVVRGSIIADNQGPAGTGSDCSGVITSEGHNLVGVNTGCIDAFPPGLPNANDDYVGTAALPSDPGVGPLTGSPGYRPVRLGSLAIDKIPAADCRFVSMGTNPLFADGESVVVDQRDVSRDSSCDIGAFEHFLAIDPLDGLSISENGGQASFSVALPFQPSMSVTIPVVSTDPGSATVDTTELTFTVAQWDDVKTVTVTGLDDDIDEEDSVIAVQLLVVQSGDAAFADVDPPDVEITVVDNDTAGLTALSSAGLVTSEWGVNAQFEVVLDSEPLFPVTMSIVSTNPDEGIPDVDQLLFTTDAWDAPQQITVLGQNDDVFDGDVPYSIELSTESSDPNYSGLGPVTVDVVNQDDVLFIGGFET
ncbi:MAG: hypothetical protein QNJ40_07985 [Xanthomonadales bacterium]|nr:hypothetical protein [Xanthomonadales bacterium]